MEISGAGYRHLVGDFQHRNSLKDFLAYSGANNIQSLAIPGAGNHHFSAISSTGFE